MVMRVSITLLLLASSVAPATGHAESLQRIYQRGIAQMDAGNYEDAIRLLKQADATAGDSPLRAQIRLHIGLNLALGGSFGAAQRYFAAALAVDPTLTFDADTYGPKVYRLFQDVLSRLGGSLRVESDVRGARVMVDGSPVGRTPMTRRLPIGKHLVQVDSPGHRPVERAVTVAVNRTALVQVQLLRARSTAKPRYLWTWLSAGSAVAAGGAGLALYLLAGAQVDEYNREGDTARRAEIKDAIRTKETVSYILAGVAAALVVTSTVAYFIEKKRSRRGTRKERRRPSRARLSAAGLTLRW